MWKDIVWFAINRAIWRDQVDWMEEVFSSLILVSISKDPAISILVIHSLSYLPTERTHSSCHSCTLLQFPSWQLASRYKVSAVLHNMFNESLHASSSYWLTTSTKLPSCSSMISNSAQTQGDVGDNYISNWWLFYIIVLIILAWDVFANHFQRSCHQLPARLQSLALSLTEQNQGFNRSQIPWCENGFHGLLEGLFGLHRGQSRSAYKVHNTCLFRSQPVHAI